MKQIGSIEESRQNLGAGLTKITEIDTSNISVLMLDVANAGASAFTGFEVRAAVGDKSPARNVSPASWTVEGLLVWYPGRAALNTLSPGDWCQIGLNVSGFDRIEVWGSGTGATGVVSGGGYEAKS